MCPTKRVKPKSASRGLSRDGSKRQVLTAQSTLILSEALNPPKKQVEQARAERLKADGFTRRTTRTWHAAHGVQRKERSCASSRQQAAATLKRRLEQCGAD